MIRLPVFLVLASLILGGALRGQAAKPVLVFGTYQKGSNITEPRPQKSAYLETLHGGIVVIREMAGYYLYTKVIKRPAKDLYVVVEYENPSGGKAFSNDMLFKTTAEELHFSSPGFVKGLKSYSDYTITVHIFDSKDAKAPLDTLEQTIRCYVDTTGQALKTFKGLKIQTSP